MRSNKKSPLKSDKTQTIRTQKRGVVGYSRKTALLEEAITQMNAGKYGRSSAALKELLALDPINMEARRLFATLHLRLGSLIPAKEAFDSLITEAFQRQDYWLAESLLREYLAAGPRCVPFLEKLGSIYQEKGDTLEAVAEYGKAIDILIEDPDPENPHHAAQLYARIRELAPVSPVAFRLASFFDAETGELLARQPSSSEASTAAPAADALDDGLPGPAHSELTTRAMPWDVQEPPEVNLQPETPSSQERPTSPAESAKSDVSVQEVQHPDLVSPGASTVEQAASHLTEVQANVRERTAAREIETRPAADAIHSVLQHGTVEAPQSSVLPIGSPVENPTVGCVPEPAVLVGDTVPSEKPEPLSKIASHEERAIQSDNASVSTPVEFDSSKVSEPSMSSLKGGSDPSVTFSLQDEARPSSTSLMTESVPSVPLPESHTDLSLSQTPNADILRIEESADDSNASRPSQASETVESWREPGFSWESVFNTAWKFSNLSAVKDSLPQSAPTHFEEATGEAPGASSPRDPLVEYASREIPEQGASTTEAASGPPMVSMPWDQVQESTILIEPTQSESPIVEGTVPTHVQEAPGVSSPHDQLVDHPSREIPERDTERSSTAEAAAGLPIASMPWDQVQESSIPIQPMQPESPVVESAVPAHFEEAPGEVSGISPPQDQLVEHVSREISEQDLERSSTAEAASGSPMAPMPHDQVQESSISIQQALEDHPKVVSMELVVDRSPDLADTIVAQKNDEIPSQPPRLSNGLTAEPETFSNVQDSTKAVSPAETGEATLPIAGAGSSVELDSALFRIASSPAAEQAPMPDESAVLEPLVPSHEPITDVPVGQSDVCSQHPESVLRAEEIQAAARPGRAIPKSKRESLAPQSPPVDEIADTAIEDSRPPQPIQSPQRAIEPASESTEAPVPRRVTSESVAQEDPWPKVASVESRTSPSDAASVQEEEWAKTTDSIRFISDPPTNPSAQAPQPISGPHDLGRPISAAAAAVDVLFESSHTIGTTEARGHAAGTKSRVKSSQALKRASLAITSFVHSCFSTTRAIVTTLIGLVVLSGLFVALGIGALALTWVIMEEPPSPAFQSFTTTPQRTLSDSKKNAYTVLMGIDTSAEQDAPQAGPDGKSESGTNQTALACFGTPGSEAGNRSNASASVMRGWIRSTNPVHQFQSHQETIKGWGGQHQVALERYSQWQKLPFEDWGYGQSGSPPCAAMAFTHQLHVADGFMQGTDIGVDRLETDMETWRAVLAQARTLPVKMLALQAINDNIAVASDMLIRSDFDNKYLGRITKFLRPLDHGELSMRWPMQSELVSATKTYGSQLKTARAEEQSVYATVASILPLPKQRRLNDYAKYYDASYKATGEKQYGSLPKWKDHIHFPAAGMTDYVTNPIENIVGLEPLPAWDFYNGLIVDTDAHLRLASLQAWLRRGSSESDLVTRIAKAGQGFYDPYTGLPMLVNMKKGFLYSVGHDGKDQDADPELDVVVEIPVAHTPASSAKPSAASSKPR